MIVMVTISVAYLLMRFEGPVLLDVRVTEVLYLLQHGCDESGPQMACICGYTLSLLVGDILSFPHVVVEGR